MTKAAIFIFVVATLVMSAQPSFGQSSHHQRPDKRGSQQDFERTREAIEQQRLGHQRVIDLNNSRRDALDQRLRDVRDRFRERQDDAEPITPPKHLNNEN